MSITNMASDNSLTDVDKGNAASPYSNFNDYGDYKDFSNPQLKDRIDKGFAYSLSGDSKDVAIPLLGDQSRDHMDSGFVNPLSGDTGFSIPLLGDQEDFSNPYPSGDKDSFIASKLPNDRMGFVNTLSNHGDEDEDCPKYSRKLSEDCPQLQSDEKRFSPERFMYEAGCTYQPPSRHNNGDGFQCDGSGTQCDGLFIDGYTRFPPVGGSPAMKESHNSARSSGKAFPKSLENILKKIDSITDPPTGTGGSQCLEDEKSLHDRFRNENTKDNQLKSRRPSNRIERRRDFESKQPYARNIRGRESGGMEIRDTNYQRMSYLKCQITTPDHKICPKGFRFWYEVLPHMYYSHMERLYQLSVNNSTILLSCPYNDPELGICCESKFATSQPYDCDKPFNEQLAQALFCLTNHIEELHNGRSSSGQCPICNDDLLVRPYIGREMAQFWIHLVTHLPEFLALPPGSIPGKPLKLSVRGDLHCVCDYHFVSAHDYVSHIVNHHTADILAAAQRDGWVKLNCPAVKTCRFETRRVEDVEREVELGLAYSQLFDHIREWHATGKNVIAPVHHCPTCLVSTKGMPDHVVWRHVARHEDLGAYFCRPCQVFVLRRDMENHLPNCRAFKETPVGGKGDVALKETRVGGKGDVKERLLQLSGSVRLPARPIAGEIEQRMPQRDVRNRHRPPAKEMEHRMPARGMEHRMPVGGMEHRMPARGMENRMPVGGMEHRMPVGEIEHRMPAGEMNNRMRSGEIKNRMAAGEMDHGMHPREMLNRLPVREMEYSHSLPVGHRLPTRDMEYKHRLSAGEMEYSHRVPAGEMEYSQLPGRQMEQRMPAREMETGEMKYRMPVGEMENKMKKMPTGDIAVKKRVLKINIWDERTRRSSGWEMADPEGQQQPLVGRHAEKYFGIQGNHCSLRCNLESKNPLEMLQNRPEDNDSFNQSVEDSSLVKAQFELQYSTKDIKNKNSVEKDFNQNVKLPFIEEPELGWGDFSNLEKPEPLDRFQGVENFNDEVKPSHLDEVKSVKVTNQKEPAILDNSIQGGLVSTIGHKNLSNAFTRKEDEVTTSEKIIQVKSNDLNETYIIPKESNLDEQNDVNEASPVQVIEHKKIKVTLLNREKATDLDKNPGGSSPTISSTYTQDTCGDTSPAIASTLTQNTRGDTSPAIVSSLTQDTRGDTSPAIASTLTQDTRGDTSPAIARTLTQDTRGDTTPTISSTFIQDTCGETKSSQETCKARTEVLNKQSVKQFSCDVCGTKFMKEHILNFHRAIHKK